MNIRIYRSSLIIILASIFLIGEPVYAHGFGERYDLPVPLGLYLGGAAAVVIYSFIVIGLFLKTNINLNQYPSVNIFKIPFLAIFGKKTFINLIKLSSSMIFLLVIISGLLGDQEPNNNLAPTMIWVIGWVGIAYTSALVGNIWLLINPWNNTFWIFQALDNTLNKGKISLIGRLKYTESYGMWPAVLLLMIFAWVELVYVNSSSPFHLAILLLVYSIITWTGMILFGKERWLENGEIFSIIFGILAKFAPSEAYRRGKDLVLNLRPPAVELTLTESKSLSEMTLIITLLATITFDGFMATPIWADITDTIYEALPNMTLISTVGLLSSIALFVITYIAVCKSIAIASNNLLTTKNACISFIHSLVPISLAYHLAHFLSYLLIQGQLVIPLSSDPLGFGWDLFGSADYKLNIAIIGARFAWITAVISIVVGHIIAVYIGHVVAIKKLGNRKTAIQSQIPMLGLMIIYTITSLWILAQPITEIH